MRTVLIVDDSSYMRTRMLAELRRSRLAEAEVLEAASGSAALAVLDARPDVGLVIVDLDMPGMSGVDFADALRAREQQGARVVLTASEWMDGVRERALDAGVDALLTRPFSSTDLDRAAA